MLKNFNKGNENARIPCNDESDFHIFCGMNGFIPEQFTQDDGWQGLFVELSSGYFVYYFGEAYMCFFEME